MLLVILHIELVLLSMETQGPRDPGAQGPGAQRPGPRDLEAQEPRGPRPEAQGAGPRNLPRMSQTTRRKSSGGFVLQ